MPIQLKNILLVVFMMCVGVFILSNPTFAQDAADSLKPYITAVDQTQGGMTLWEMIKSGGVIMLVLLLLSISGAI